MLEELIGDEFKAAVRDRGLLKSLPGRARIVQSSAL